VNVSSAQKFLVAPISFATQHSYASSVNCKKNVCALQVFHRAARVRRPHFSTLGFTIITRNYYTKLCTTHWSRYHGSSAKPVQYNGVSSPHSNAKVIEILKKDLPLFCSD